MKTIITILLMIFTTMALAVVQDVTPGVYTQGHWSATNYIKNPFCFANTNDISTTGSAAKGRTTSSPLDGGASCTIAGTALADKVKWATRTLDNSLNLQNCEARFTYSGDGTKWKAYAEQGGSAASVNIVPQGYSSLPDTGTGSKTAYAYFPCGTNSTATSLTFESTATAAATLKISNVYIGPSTGTGSVAQAQLLGTLKYTANQSVTLDCNWTTTSTTFASFAANSSCPTPTVTGSVSAPATKKPSVVLSSMPVGDYLIIAKANFTLASAGVTTDAYYRFSDGTTTSESWLGSWAVSSALRNNSTMIGRITRTTPGTNVEIEIQGRTQSGSATAGIYQWQQTNQYIDTTIEVYYFPPASSIIQKVDQGDFDWTSFDPQTNSQGLGTLSNKDCYYKKKGSDAYVKCRYTTGTLTASEARLGLPFTVASTFSSIRTAGNVTFGTNQGVGALYALSEPGVSYLTFGYIVSGSQMPLTKRVGTDLTTGVFSVEAGPIPVSGWKETNTITGTFTDVPLAPGSGSKTDLIGFGFGTTNTNNVCSSSPCYVGQAGTGITSVTRSAAGTYSVNLARSYSKIFCSLSAQAGSSTQVIPHIEPCVSGSCSALPMMCANAANSAFVDCFGAVTCVGQY